MPALLQHPEVNDEHEKQILKGEIEELKRKRESEQSTMRVVWFLAIWILPLFGMLLVQGDESPKTAGPDFPVAGHISIWGIWFLGFPLGTFLYRKFMR